MIPSIAANGSSFKGAAAYYLHDKDTDSRERVEWTHTENLPTNDPDKAWKVMAWTANHQAHLKSSAGIKATGRKLEKPVFAFSLAWHPEQRPDKDHMLRAAREAVNALGLADHQTIYIAHNDEPHRHVHVLINRVHPETGKAATLSKSRERLSAWALAYEKQHGKIYCRARAEKKERQAPGPQRSRNPVIQAAWDKTDTGRAFQAALAAEKFTLAWGNKRVVVVDRWGKTLNPVRHLAGVRASAFNARLRDIDRSALPRAATIQKSIKTEERKQYHASRAYDRWAARYLNQLQDRHIDERDKLQIHYERQRDEKAVELAEYYQTEEKDKAIERLQKQIAASGFLRRVTGGIKRDRAELSRLEQIQESGQERIDEALAAIQTEKDLAMPDQQDRHEREWELAREYIAEKKPDFYKEEEIMKETTRSPARDEGGRQRALDRDGGPP